jgi:2-amino-4-hydroxy-6-hydroxymethyldihydropteridine diphosphokinase
MTACFLGIGSNLGNKRANLDRAVELLASNPRIDIVAVSTFYETAPVGYSDQPDFLNGVLMIETDLSPHELLTAILETENQMGRKRTIRWGPRVIDVDILLYDAEKVDQDGLQIPHPRMMERRFVLEPLAEIASDLVLPDGRTALQAFQDLLAKEQENRN